jgi:hypothetical protein
MSEVLISPGVFLQENDLSQITQGPLQTGATILGPTVTGPVNIPTRVTSYSEYKAIFGAAFISGGYSYEYLTSVAALNYFEQGGDSLLVTRVASGSYTSATASVLNSTNAVSGTIATATLSVSGLNASQTGSYTPFTIVDNNNNYIYILPATFGVDYNDYNAQLDYGYFSPNAGNAYTLAQWSSSLATFNNTYAASETRVTITAQGNNLIVSASAAGTSFNGYKFYVGGWFGATTGSMTLLGTLSGGTNPVNDYAFTLETLSTGVTMNNVGGTVTNGALPTGSSANIRWEIASVDSGSGTFSLLVRRGDDYNNNKTILETWTGLSLDPNQNNYIGYVIGDQYQVAVADEFGNYYLQTYGSYQNKSKYVRVKSVNTPTPGYFDATGQPKSEYFTSLPLLGSGSVNGAFGGATGALYGSFGLASLNLYESIPTTTTDTNSNNIQGLLRSNYNVALSLLGNKDAYRFDTIFAPGLTSQNAPSQINSLLTLAQERGDCIAVIDTVGYAQNLSQATNEASNYDNSYGATYWPWLQVRSRETGKINFVPASTLIPAIYEYNDKIAAEWFAPAGLNRGGMGTVLQPERKLSNSDRNALYQGRVNPIANFPGIGTVVYGQKTLQSKASATDRVNVRRMLIELKSYIGQIGETLVFEPNTQATRNRFLNQVNPYLETVQQRQGLYAFQVIMDETNNTPDVIDRNQLIGSIYLQPTRAAEFIYLNFNITQTGASFS